MSALRQLGWRVLALGALAYVAWLTILYFLQDQMIFPGCKLRQAGDSFPKPADAESLWIDAAPGVRVEAWFLPGAGPTPEKPGPLVVFAHGNAELIDDGPPFLQTYREWGLSVLLVEYRGFGRSGGTPTEAGIVADFAAFLERIRARPEVDPAKIVYHGRSIGGAVLAQLAVRRPPAALILESTPDSIAGMAARYGAPPWLVRSPFRTDLAVARIEAPILLLHGAADDIIPPSHSRRLAKRAGGKAKLVEAPGGHNDFPRDPEAYWWTIRAFIEPLTAPAGPP
jgi:hypothetical protein